MTWIDEDTGLSLNVMMWRWQRCTGCRGTGMRDVGGWGGVVPGECDLCNGGIYWVSPNGTLAAWPGGPFLGSKDEEEYRTGSIPSFYIEAQASAMGALREEAEVAS